MTFLPEVAIVLELTSEEIELLREMLEEYRRELLHEISHTDHTDFRHRLRERVQLVATLISKSEAQERVAA